MSTTDQATIKRQQDAQKLKAKQNIADLQKLATMPEFQRFFWELLSRAGIYETSFHASGSVVYYNEGRRSIGLQYIREINDHAPEALFKMMTTNKTQQSQTAEINTEGLD